VEDLLRRHPKVWERSELREGPPVPLQQELGSETADDQQRW
jgi:hypothetical protein